MEFVKLGKAVKLHGYMGAIKVQTMFDTDFDVKQIHEIFDKDENKYTVNRIFEKNGAVVIESPEINLEKAKTLIGKEIFVERTLFDGKILFEDLKNSTAYLDDGTQLGKVIDVQDFGTAEVITIKQEDDKELMFPNVNGIIKSFDYITKKVILSKQKLLEVSDYED